MPTTKSPALRRKPHDAPELLIAYLQYALNDVRALSERGGHHLEKAIEALTEDISLVDISPTVLARHRS